MAALRRALLPGLGAALVLALVAAALTALLAPAPAAAPSWSERFHSFVGGRSVPGALLGAAGAGLLYVGVHGVIGASVWPLVRPYYTDPARGLALRVPSPRVMLPFQAGRGLVGVAALLPWLLVVPIAGVGDWLALWLTMATTMGVVPLLAAPGWPPRLRLLHAAEIIVIAAAWSFLIWKIALP